MTRRPQPLRMHRHRRSDRRLLAVWSIAGLRLPVPADHRDHHLLVQHRAPARGVGRRSASTRSPTIVTQARAAQTRCSSRSAPALIAAVLATLLGTLAGIALARQPGQVGVLVHRAAAARVGHPRDRRRGRPAAVAGVPGAGPRAVDLQRRHRAPRDRALAVRRRGGLLHRARPAGRSATRTSRRPRPISTRRRSTTFRRVTLPLAMPAVLAGVLLAFTFSLDNTDRRGVRAGVGIDAVAGLRAERRAQRPASRDRRGVDDHAAAHPGRPRRRRAACSSARATRRPRSRAP